MGKPGAGVPSTSLPRSPVPGGLPKGPDRARRLVETGRWSHIPLDQIVDNPFNARTTFDQAALQSLADEMKAEGAWNITLQGRRTGNGTIELVFGHRRVRAFRLRAARHESLRPRQHQSVK